MILKKYLIASAMIAALSSSQSIANPKNYLEIEAFKAVSFGVSYINLKKNGFGSDDLRVDARGNNQFTFLLSAVHYEHWKLAKKLMENHPELIPLKDSAGNNILHMLAKKMEYQHYYDQDLYEFFNFALEKMSLEQIEELNKEGANALTYLMRGHLSNFHHKRIPYVFKDFHWLSQNLRFDTADLIKDRYGWLINTSEMTNATYEAILKLKDKGASFETATQVKEKVRVDIARVRAIYRNYNIWISENLANNPHFSDIAYIFTADERNFYRPTDFRIVRDNPDFEQRIKRVVAPGANGYATNWSNGAKANLIQDKARNGEDIFDVLKDRTQVTVLGSSGQPLTHILASREKFDDVQKVLELYPDLVGVKNFRGLNVLEYVATQFSQIYESNPAWLDFMEYAAKTYPLELFSEAAPGKRSLYEKLFKAIIEYGRMDLLAGRPMKLNWLKENSELIQLGHQKSLKKTYQDFNPEIERLYKILTTLEERGIKNTAALNLARYNMRPNKFSSGLREGVLVNSGFLFAEKEYDLTLRAKLMGGYPIENLLKASPKELQERSQLLNYLNVAVKGFLNYAHRNNADVNIVFLANKLKGYVKFQNIIEMAGDLSSLYKQGRYDHSKGVQIMNALIDNSYFKNADKYNETMTITLNNLIRERHFELASYLVNHYGFEMIPRTVYQHPLYTMLKGKKQYKQVRLLNTLMEKTGYEALTQILLDPQAREKLEKVRNNELCEKFLM